MCVRSDSTLGNVVSLHPGRVIVQNVNTNFCLALAWDSAKTDLWYPPRPMSLHPTPYFLKLYPVQKLGSSAKHWLLISFSLMTVHIIVHKKETQLQRRRKKSFIQTHKESINHEEISSEWALRVRGEMEHELFGPLLGGGARQWGHPDYHRYSYEVNINWYNDIFNISLEETSMLGFLCSVCFSIYF